MIWTGMSTGGHTDLCFIQNSVFTTQIYLDKITQLVVLPHTAAVGEQFYFMNDNARPHKGNLTTN